MRKYHLQHRKDPVRQSRSAGESFLVCSLCRELLPAEEFNWKGTAKRHRMSRCKACALAVDRESRVDPAYRRRQYQRVLAAHARRTPEERIARNFRISAIRLGIDPDLIAAYRVGHDNLCEICGKTAQESNQTKTRLCIDHDHETGEFRGLLCTSCNVMLGIAEDNPEILLAAARYLRKTLPSASRGAA